jgi:pimeloyl-ACP methyl ester carboxylesterase
VTTGLEAARSRGLYVERTRAESGPGAPLVACIHGSMDRHTSFARLRARLAPTCDVLVYDRRGYAESRDAEPPAAGMEDHIADLLDLLEGRRAVLFGHSYGGDVALALAERHPELVATAVVFEAPTPWLDFWHAPGTARDRLPWSGTTPEGSAEQFLRRMIGDRRYERIPASTRLELLRDGRALDTELAAIRRDPPPFDPARIGVPVVVAWGSATLERHRRGSEWLASSVPHAVSRIVEGAGHDGHRTHSKEISELVLAAAGRVAAESATPRVPT